MMRVASNQFHATMNAALQRAQGRLESTLQKMAEGKKHLVASEDPVSTVRLMRLSRETAALEQYQTNIKALQTRLNINESLLSGMVDDLTDARDLLVWAANGGNSSEDVNAMAGPLGVIRDGLFAVANRRDEEGRYIFSGTATATPTITYDPMQPVGSRYSWTGNSVKQKVGVGNDVTADANVTLEDLAATLNQLDQAVATLSTSGVNPNDPAVRAQVNATLNSVDSALGDISYKIGQLGGEQNILATLLGNHENVQLSNDQAYLALGQLDYGDAAVRLNGYTAALEATQKAYARVNSLSLFDVI